MSEHYYTQNPQSRSNVRQFETEFEGEKYVFLYDNGVFSKGRLDDGTRILLSAAEDIDGDVLDLGCGWGAVGTIIGRKFPQSRILLSDINERALEMSRQNLALNKITNAAVVQSDSFENIGQHFDCIFTNPPIRTGKKQIYRMFDEALAHLKAGGRLYIVIRKQQGAESALKYLEGANPAVVEKDKGYWVICCRPGQEA